MVLVAVPFMVLSDNTTVEFFLRLLINFQKGLELLVISLSPIAFRCSLLHFLKERSQQRLNFLLTSQSPGAFVLLALSLALRLCLAARL